MTDPNKTDLDTLFPEPATVTIADGEVITIAEFKFGQFPRAVRLFRPVIDAVQSAGIAGMGASGFVFASDWVLRLPRVLDEAGDALIEFVGFAIGKPRAWFDALGADDGIALTKAVFESNASFFSRKIAPALGLQLQPSAPATPTALDGDTSSPDSSPAVTPEPTSAT